MDSSPPEAICSGSDRSPRAFRREAFLAGVRRDHGPEAQLRRAWTAAEDRWLHDLDCVGGPPETELWGLRTRGVPADLGAARWSLVATDDLDALPGRTTLVALGTSGPADDVDSEDLAGVMGELVGAGVAGDAVGHPPSAALGAVLVAPPPNAAGVGGPEGRALGLGLLRLVLRAAADARGGRPVVACDLTPWSAARRGTPLDAFWIDPWTLREPDSEEPADPRRCVARALELA